MSHLLLGLKHFSIESFEFVNKIEEIKLGKINFYILVLFMLRFQSENFTNSVNYLSLLAPFLSAIFQVSQLRYFACLLIALYSTLLSLPSLGMCSAGVATTAIGIINARSR